MIQFKKIIIITLCAVWLGAMVAVIAEYRFFSAQAQQMQQLQSEYRNYVQVVKTIVDDYAKTKERLVLLEELAKGEKKNSELGDSYGFDMPFPEGSRIYSSDDEELENSESFLVVNRELEYLKEATISCIKEAELDALCVNIDWSEWKDYSEQLLAQRKSVSRKTSRPVISASRTKPKKSSYTLAKKMYVRDMAFAWPIDRSRFWLSSFFGPRKKKNGAMGFHHGIDMAALKGTSVMASAEGVVVEARYAPGYGNTILLAHNGKYKTRYAHLDAMFVHAGQTVQRGALIGTVGTTGHVRSIRGRDPSHLHFELYVFGKKVNPMHFLQG